MLKTDYSQHSSLQSIQIVFYQQLLILRG